MPDPQDHGRGGVCVTAVSVREAEINTKDTRTQRSNPANCLRVLRVLVIESAVERSHELLREEVKTITDKVLNMAKADGVEVRFSGGERSATRYANSTITAEPRRARSGSVPSRSTTARSRRRPPTHQFDDASLKSAIEQAQELAKRRPDNPELMPLVKPPQDYLPIDGRCRRRSRSGPAERARMVKQSVDVCEKKGVLGSGYIPKLHWTDALRELEGLVRATTATPRRASSSPAGRPMAPDPAGPAPPG